MKYFKKIYYLIFAIIIELLLGNFLFGMERDKLILKQPLLDQYYLKNGKQNKRQAARLLNTELEPFEEISLTENEIIHIRNVVEAIAILAVNLKLNKEIRSSLIKIKEILCKINTENRKKKAEGLKEIKYNLQKIVRDTKKSQQINREGEIHASLISPIVQINQIIILISNIIEKLKYQNATLEY